MKIGLLNIVGHKNSVDFIADRANPFARAFCAHAFYVILLGNHSTISWKKYVPSTAASIKKNSGKAVRAM